MAGYTESQLRDAVSKCFTIRDVLEEVGLRSTGGNYRTLHNWMREWGIPCEHLSKSMKARYKQSQTPLELVLVEGSSYSRASLKRRLFDLGIKQRACEMCGQGEEWRGAKLSLILDHINGVHDDNRIENLRILCPNCNATLPTHCGRAARKCAQEGCRNRTGSSERKFCAEHMDRVPRKKRLNTDPRPSSRKVERPSYDVLMQEIAETSFLAVGKKYGVSDNAVRKWVKTYQRR